jgi:hypothetical protein
MLKQPVRKVWEKIQESMAGQGFNHPIGCPCFLHDVMAWTHRDIHRFVSGKIDERTLMHLISLDRKARQEGRRYDGSHTHNDSHVR